MDLAGLKAERAERKSYLGYLGLDLLGFLWNYLKGSLVYFRGQVISQETITHGKTCFGYAAHNQDYFIIPFPRCLEFYSQTGQLIRSFVSLTTQHIHVRLEGPIARFYADQQIHTLDLTTNQLSSQPAPLHLADINNIAFVLIRKHDVIVEYRVGGHRGLCRVNLVKTEFCGKRQII